MIVSKSCAVETKFSMGRFFPLMVDGDLHRIGLDRPALFPRHHMAANGCTEQHHIAHSSPCVIGQAGPCGGGVFLHVASVRLAALAVIPPIADVRPYIN